MMSQIWNIMFSDKAVEKIVEALRIENEELKAQIQSGQQYRGLEAVRDKYDRLLQAARLSLDTIVNIPEDEYAFGTALAEAARGLQNSYWFGDEKPETA